MILIAYLVLEVLHSVWCVILAIYYLSQNVLETALRIYIMNKMEYASDVLPHASSVYHLRYVFLA